MNWKHPEGYSILVEKGDTLTERRGIFLFKRKGGGIVWIETGYLDPWNAGHTLHEAEGTLTEKENEIRVTGKDRTYFIAYADDGDIRADFDRLAKEAKTTFRSERAILKKGLKDLIEQ